MPDQVDIVADIGGTNARFAWVSKAKPQPQQVETFACADFEHIAHAISLYLKKIGRNANEACLAVAAPLDGDDVKLLNNHWSFNRRDLQNSLGFPVNVINDFTAQMLSVDAVVDDDLYWIGDARPVSAAEKVRAILGPGTGLGVAALTPSGDILPSEGGHVGFAPVSQHQVDILTALWQRHKRISVERLLSGMGLENLYWANCYLEGREHTLTAAEVTEGAQQQDKHCVAAVQDFLNIMAAVAGDVALMTGAWGGVYLAGGILPRLLDQIDQDAFREQFANKGRFAQRLNTIPLAINLSKYAGLIGCAQWLRGDQSRP